MTDKAGNPSLKNKKQTKTGSSRQRSCIEYSGISNLEVTNRNHPSQMRMARKQKMTSWSWDVLQINFRLEKGEGNEIVVALTVSVCHKKINKV